MILLAADYFICLLDYREKDEDGMKPNFDLRLTWIKDLHDET